MKKTWEKVFEYASMPVHGTLSRKLRKGVTLQINEGEPYKEAVIFLGEEFVRITAEEKSKHMNTYYDWTAIASIRTYSPKDEK
ncbi:MAG: hypothetical protein R3297_01615 [Desulfobulbales bacterium]|nr:hypothetical protein [Desulfobulbales bacterium]